MGQTPSDCIFKVSTWLSKYLWEAIQETLQAATVGMDYLRKLARVVTKEQNDNGTEVSVAINWMRCCMAMNKHFENGGSFDEKKKAQEGFACSFDLYFYSFHST